MCQVSTSGCNRWVSGGWGRNITKFIRSNKKKHWHSREICWILKTLLISVPNRILLMSVISSVETNSWRINWSPLSKAISSLPCFWRILVRDNFEANAWCEEHASFDVIYGRYLYSTSKFYMASSNVLPVLKSEFSLNFLQRMALYAPTFLQGLQLGSKNVVFKPSMFAISNRWARLRPKRTSLGSQEKTRHLDVPCPMDGTSMNDSELRMAATPEPAFKGDKPSHPIMDSVKLRNSEFDGHFLSIGNMIFLVEFLWVCM